MASSPGGGPLSHAILPLRGTRREGSHPDGWGLCRRGPAGRCAGVNAPTGRTGRRSRACAPSALSRARRNCIFTATAQRSSFLYLRPVRRTTMCYPRAFGPLCRPEVGVPLPAAPPSVSGRPVRSVYLTAQKTNGSELRSLPACSGESVKGGKLPLSQENNDQSELAAARRRRARKFRFPSQEGLGVGSPDPNPSCSGLSVRLSPHFGRPARSAGRIPDGARRCPSERSRATPPRGPVRDPLDGWMRGLEPPTTGTTIRCSAIELHPPPRERRPTGAPGRIRTPDPRLRRPPLYPTELLALPRFVVGTTGNAGHASVRPVCCRGERI